MKYSTGIHGETYQECGQLNIDIDGAVFRITDNGGFLKISKIDAQPYSSKDITIYPVCKNVIEVD
jgi:hypothetical protein